MSDLETLLAPVSDDDPVGPDLDSDPEMVEIRNAFETGFADDDEDAPAVNWGSIVERCEALLGRSKDIWIAVYMMRAAAKADRLDSVLTGAQVLVGLVEQYWESVHPQLEEWGINARITPVASLGTIKEFVNPLKRITLLAHPRLGRYSGADFARFEQSGDGESDFGMFKAALNDVDQSELRAAMAAFETLEDALKQVDRTFMFNADGDGPNLQNTYQALGEIRSSLAFHVGDDIARADDGESAGGDGGDYADEPQAGGGGRLTGRVDSRDDVIRALDAIADYYRRKEPSSPVPVVLQRAREWVALDFLSILKDIAPNSMDDAKRVLVFAKEEQSNSWE